MPWLGPELTVTEVTLCPLMSDVRLTGSAVLKAVDADALVVVGGDGMTFSVIVSLPLPPPKLPSPPDEPVELDTKTVNVSVPV